MTAPTVSKKKEKNIYVDYIKNSNNIKHVYAADT